MTWEVQDGSWILIASDGVWDFLSSDEVADLETRQPKIDGNP